MIPLIEQESHGGWLFKNDGSVFTLGNAPFYGSFADLARDEKVLAAGQTSCHNYYVVTNRGRLLSCGNIRESRAIADSSDTIIYADVRSNSVAFLTLSGYIRVMKTNSRTDATDFFIDQQVVNADAVVSILLTKSGEGIYILYKDGTIQTVGDAQHLGDFVSEKISASACDLAQNSWGKGYWVIDDIGGVFCFGDADYFGSVPEDGMKISAQCIIGHFSGRGYWIVSNDGMVLPFGYADVYERDRSEKHMGVVGFVPYVIDASCESHGIKSTISLAHKWIESSRTDHEKQDVL